MISRTQKIILAAAIVAIAGVVTWQTVPTKSAEPPPPIERIAPPEVLAAMAKSKEKKMAQQEAAKVNDERTQLTFERVSAGTLEARISNTTSKPFTLDVKAGEIFDKDGCQIVALKGVSFDLKPGASETRSIPVAAARSTNPGVLGPFNRAARLQASLAPLFRHLASNPEMPSTVVQTAVLAVTEDAPVDLFANFPRLRPISGITDRFKVPTADIIAAVSLLKDSGVETCKLLSDPQLKIEAMLDPASHAAAMKFYGIDPASEWAYWRQELLEGDPTLRHYALYGIGRFYPEVAIQMMPRWVLEQRTLPHYRRAAIGALAFTKKTEAGNILKSLEENLSGERELALNIAPALQYLEQNINDAP